MPVKLIPRGEGRKDFSVDVLPKESVPILEVVRVSPEKNHILYERLFTDIPTPFVSARSPLNPGEEDTLVNVITGQPMPYTVPAGKYASIKAMEIATDSPARFTLYVDGMLVSEYVLKTHEFFTYSAPLQLSSKSIDPKAQYSHTLEIRIKNIGDAPLYGKIILEIEEEPAP